RPHEICTGCGHIMVITYSVEEWQSFGRCERCNEYCEHKLQMPTAKPGPTDEGEESTARNIARLGVQPTQDDDLNETLLSPPNRAVSTEKPEMKLKIRSDVTLSQFEFITTLGRGTFGKVMKARFAPTGQIFAVKVLSKSAVSQKRMVEYIKEERDILADVNG